MDCKFISVQCAVRDQCFQYRGTFALFTDELVLDIAGYCEGKDLARLMMTSREVCGSIYSATCGNSDDVNI